MSKTALTQKLETALLNQVKRELHASKLYLSASYYFRNKHFNGIAQYLRKEYDNELLHANEISDYVAARGIDLSTKMIDIDAELVNELPAIKEDILKWSKPNDVFERLYLAEEDNQVSINALMTLSQQEADHATYEFLLHMIKEQREATNDTEDVLVKARAYGAFDGLLWHLDKMLS
eukprot:318851_1